MAKKVNKVELTGLLESAVEAALQTPISQEAVRAEEITKLTTEMLYSAVFFNKLSPLGVAQLVISAMVSDLENFPEVEMPKKIEIIEKIDGLKSAMAKALTPNKSILDATEEVLKQHGYDENFFESFRNQYEATLLSVEMNQEQARFFLNLKDRVFKEVKQVARNAKITVTDEELTQQLIRVLFRVGGDFLGMGTSSPEDLLKKAKYHAGMTRKSFRGHLRCDMCDKNQGQEYHHIVYRNVAIGELATSAINCQENLALLCRDCHDKAHNVESGKFLIQKNVELYGEEAVRNALLKILASMNSPTPLVEKLLAVITGDSE